MAGRAVANRSEPLTVRTPRGPVEVVRQQWRSQRAGSRWDWEWLARRRGQRDWKQGSTAREAIRQATLLSPGKQPGWLAAAVAEAERGLLAEAAEAPKTREGARTPVELRASTGIPASVACRTGGGGERRRGAACAGCRGRRGGAARRAACSSPRSGLGSTLATGSRSPVAAASVLALRMTFSVCLRRCGRRGGGCGIRSGGTVGETSTRWRSRRPGLRSRSRRRPGRTTVAISLGRASRRRGCRCAGERGHAMAPLASCAWSVRGASSASSTTFSWSRSIA